MANLSRLSIVKLLELLVVCILIGLHYHSFSIRNIETELITSGTFGGYLIILVGLFAGALMGTPVNRRVDLFFSIVGFALFIVAGALTIDHFRNVRHGSLHDTGMAKGSISIIEAVLLIFDAFLTFRGES